jgi:hypothetical protein
MKETTLKTFTDKPEEITTVRCVHAEGKFLVLQWDAPADNNSPLLRYNVYVSSRTIKLYDGITFDPSPEAKDP